MQGLLLDTHAFVWWLTDASKLKEGARTAIASPRNDIFVSAIYGMGDRGQAGERAHEGPRQFVGDN